MYIYIYIYIYINIYVYIYIYIYMYIYIYILLPKTIIESAMFCAVSRENLFINKLARTQIKIKHLER